MSSLQSRAVALLVSPRVVRVRQWVIDLWAKLRGASPTLTLYYQTGDAYSHLCAQLIPTLSQRLRMTIEVIVVPTVTDATNAAPDLAPTYGLLDAIRIAPAWGLDLSAEAQVPDAATRELAERVLLTADSLDSFLELEATATNALWRGDENALQTLPMCGAPAAQEQLERNYAQLKKRGHYQGGMWHFRGDWYWALDRLTHLEQRLRQVDLVIGTAALARLTPENVSLPPMNTPDSLDLFYSFRSPYSYLVIERSMALARRYNLKLNIRPVLPMVMRGFKVPRSKRLYIVRDSKREADRLGVPFGRVADPLGGGVERCLAAFPQAAAQGKAAEFILQAGRAVWSQGKLIKHEHVLRDVLQQVGLSGDIVELAPTSGVDISYAERNREALFDLGLWGVPSFQLGNIAVWGQDRTWMLEEALRRSYA